MTAAGPVLAAGAVLWRADAHEDLLVALVHRPRYDDWSLPKGKVEPGEPRTLAAVREVAEETGYEVVLGVHLAITSYRTGGRAKLVNYWAARIIGGRFTPNDEVDELRWATPAQAAQLLTYPHDIRVLERFTSLPTETSTLLMVRHAKAGSRKSFSGDDRLRPLEEEGRLQATALAPVLRAFGATTVHAADRVRCTQTVQPLADALGVVITSEPALSDDAYFADPESARRRVLEIAASGGTPVLCSQGDMIPHVMRWLAERDGVALPPSRNRKASTWVVSLHAGRTVAIDHLDAPFR
ncbi:MAG: NUDIX hydrolase [Mycobacteriaceae bacterium]